MLYLGDNQTIKDALKAHSDAIICRINKKLTGKNCDKSECITCKGTNKTGKLHKSEFLNQLLVVDNCLSQIIIGKPAQLNTCNKCINAKIEEKYTSQKDRDEILEDINYLFNYNWLIDQEPTDYYSGYHLSENLNRRTCSYCNRIYTTTKKSKNGGKLMRPQFDHWFPKETYPLLALSFYNLIPSCSICNSSSKGRTVFNLDNYVHPFVDKNQTNDFRFNYEYNIGLGDFNVFVEHTNTSKDSEKVVRTIKDLKIDTMYNAHHSELGDLIKIKEAYSDTYIEKMQKFFPDTKMSRDEVFRLLFGTEIDSNDFHKRPLSKFKHDILKGLGVL